VLLLTNKKECYHIGKLNIFVIIVEEQLRRTLRFKENNEMSIVNIIEDF